jgi:hypothetical protein
MRARLIASRRSSSFLILRQIASSLTPRSLGMGIGRPMHPGARRAVEHPGRDLKPTVSIRSAQVAAKNNAVRLADRFDRDRIRGGALYNPLLAHALCKSACMIVVYTPTYFSRKHLYCAREYRAMENLEQRRLASLQKQVSKEYGLIIPIVLRGEDLLPAAIKVYRQYYTFERFSLTSRRLARNPAFDKEIRAIAEAIHVRWQMFAAMGDDLTSNCDDFELPTEAEIQPWLDSMTQPISPFPFRKV